MELLTGETAKKYLGKYIRTKSLEYPWIEVSFIHVVKVTTLCGYGEWINVYKEDHDTKYSSSSSSHTGTWGTHGEEEVLGEITKDQFDLLMNLAKAD